MPRLVLFILAIAVLCASATPLRAEQTAGADKPHAAPSAPRHYIWKEGSWGRLVLEQNKPARWTVIESRDFMQRPAARAVSRKPSHAPSPFTFTPRRAAQASSLSYDMTLPYSKGTQLRAGIEHTRDYNMASALPFGAQYAQETSLGLRLHNGRFELANLYLRRERQDESQDYQLHVYNVTASWQLTPSTRLGIGYNRGAIDERLVQDSVPASGGRAYESMVLGGTTHFSVGGGLDLGYFYQSGPDSRHTRPDGKLFEDNYTGLLLNLQF